MGVETGGAGRSATESATGRLSPRLTASLALLLFVWASFCMSEFPRVLVLGKNADGIEYAAIARNLADGYGTFWKPYLSDHQWPVHYEQPPLMYGLQALFFLVFPDFDYVEGVYGFLVGCIVLLILSVFWRRVHEDQGLEGTGSWWPLALLMTVPQFAYLCQSNRLIPTFMVFALLSVYFSYRSISGRGRVVVHAMLAGLLMYLGFLTKGPFSLFTLAVPAAGWLTLRAPHRRATLSTAVTAVTFALAFGSTLLISEDSRALWSDLLQRQVYDTVIGEREAHSRFELVGDLLQRTIGPLALYAVVILVVREPLRRLHFSRLAAFFLLVALAGSVPLLLTPRQKFRYMMHAIPLLLFSMALVTGPAAAKLESLVDGSRRVRVGIAATTAVVFLGAIGFMIHQAGAVVQEHAFFEDVYLQDLGIPPRSTMSVVPKDLVYDHHFFQYAPRFMKVSVTEELGHEFLVVELDHDFVVPADYRQINRPVLKYAVYRKVTVDPPGP